MADLEPFDQATDWYSIAKEIAAGWLAVHSTSGVSKAYVSQHVEAEGAIFALMMDLAEDLAFRLGVLFTKIETPVLPLLAGFTAPIVGAMFETNVSEGAFLGKRDSGARKNVARALVESMFAHVMQGATANPAPSLEQGKRLVAAGVHATLEGWFNASLPEMISDCIPFEFGHFTELGKLPEELASTLGIPRMVRRIMAPIIDATSVEPVRRYAHDTYRPALLSPSAVARQWARGRWDWPDVVKELAWQGYTEERIDALINEQRKFFSPSDVRVFVYRGEWNNDKGLQHLRDQGYDDQAASDALRLEGLKRIAAVEQEQAAAIIGAFVARDIDEGTFNGAMAAAVTVDAERALLSLVAHTRRDMRIKRLSLGEVAAMVKSGVLATSDYREAAAREGYPPEDILALELQLRWELNTLKSVADHKRDLEVERAQQRAQREAEAAAKKAAAEAVRALDRRGAEKALEDAYVRGLIPIGRVTEVLDPRYDADTVAVLVAALDDRRQAFLDAQQQREDARKRAGHKGLDIARLDAAVVEGVLTLGEYRARVAAAGLDAADVDVLAATLQAKIAAQRAAQHARDEAAAAAKVKHIDLARFEWLVRRGHRTLAEYDHLLAGLGYDAGSRAAIGELLQIHVADDAKAAAVRQAAEAKLNARGLSWDQVRRAVILGIRDLGTAERFLVEQKFTADAVAVLLAELQADVNAANAARQRRRQADGLAGSQGAPLGDVRRAARLGMISVGAYQARLGAAGYSADDVALELDLLVYELAQTRAHERAAAVADAAPPALKLTLAQLAQLVERGLRSITDYTTAAMQKGYRGADLDGLVALVQDRADLYQLAARRRQAMLDEGGTKALTVAQLEKAVKAGDLAIDAFTARLEDLGFGADDAELLTTLLADTLGAAGPAPGASGGPGA